MENASLLRHLDGGHSWRMLDPGSSRSAKCVFAKFLWLDLT
jgi:hypothetical protein